MRDTEDNVEFRFSNLHKLYDGLVEYYSQVWGQECKQKITLTAIARYVVVVIVGVLSVRWKRG